MIYADSKDAARLRQAPYLGSFNLVKQVLAKVGIIDLVSKYEPGVPEPQVFAKYNERLTRFSQDLSRISNGTARESLAAKLRPLLSQRDRLAHAYAPGATAGAADRDALGQLVLGTRTFATDFHAAEKQYGVNAAPPPVRTEPGAKKPAPPPSSDMGTGVKVGLGLLGLFIAMKAFGK